MATILTVAFAFGSAVYAFTNKYLLLAVVILFYILVQRLLSRHRRQKLIGQTVVYHGGKIYKLQSIFDSGNALRDPVSKAPVSIISLPVFLAMFPEITADKIMLDELDESIAGHYINCRTVNGRSKIFVFKPDKMKINGTTVNDCLLGVSPKDFGNVQYDALLNAQLGGLS